VAKANRFSLHAALAAQARERARLERLCRYISRPTVAVERLSLTAHGPIRYTLKPPRTETTRPTGCSRLRIAPRSGDSAEAWAGRGKTGALSTPMRWAQRLKRVFAIQIERCDGADEDHCRDAAMPRCRDAAMPRPRTPR
jgi:hypothetical protein